MIFSPRHRFRPIVLSLCVTAVFFVASQSGMFASWTHRASDQLFLSRSVDPSITIIAIDDASITQIGRWPWSRSVHADLVRALTSAGVRAVGYDVNFPETSTEADDNSFADALRQSKNIVLPVELTLASEGERLLRSTGEALVSIPIFASAASSTGHSNTPPDSDGVVRSIPLSVFSKDTNAEIPSFVSEVARLAGYTARIAEAPTSAERRMVIHFPGAPSQNFRTISAVDVLRRRVDLSPLRNGIVFVGATAPDLHDVLLVPTSNGVPMPGVEIHASAFDTLIGAHWLREVPAWMEGVLFLILALVVGFAVTYAPSKINLPLILVTWVGGLVLGFMMFDRGYVPDLVFPSFAIVFSYAAVTLERRITADRERRELKAAFSQYVSASVVESILKDPSKLKLGGERKRMSVLFSDIRGFTNISEGLSPEKLVDMLNRYLNRMTELVFDHAGVLDKYIGDAVMAFWNAPFDQPDHAARSVRTALAMRDVLASMNQARAFGDLELKIGIGINTGDMVVGNVGGAARFDYTVIGDNVNLASRLESLTKEYGVTVIITQATRDEVKDLVLTREIDKVAVKGKKEPVVIYEAMELSSKATAEQQQLATSFTQALASYFGRDFGSAITACQQILAVHPNDGPSKTLLERATTFATTPPPSEWNGTWVYTKK